MGSIKSGETALLPPAAVFYIETCPNWLVYCWVSWAAFYFLFYVCCACFISLACYLLTALPLFEDLFAAAAWLEVFAAAGCDCCISTLASSFYCFWFCYYCNCNFFALRFEWISSIGIRSSLTIALALFFKVSKKLNDLFFGMRPRRDLPEA